MCGIGTGFKSSPSSNYIVHPTQGLYQRHHKRQNQRNKLNTKNRMFQVNIQSLLHETGFGLGHQRKPVEHEILLQRSPSFNKGKIRETRHETISVSLTNAYPYTQENAKQSYYPPLKHSALCEAPSNPLIQEPHLSERDRKKNITNKRNIFTVKPIKCSIQEVVAESFAAPNIPTVDVARSLCSIIQRD